MWLIYVPYTHSKHVAILDARQSVNPLPFAVSLQSTTPTP